MTVDSPCRMAEPYPDLVNMATFTNTDTFLIPAARKIRVIRTDDKLTGVSAADFEDGDDQAPLVLAYISPHVDFAAVTQAITHIAADTRLVAVSTAGELCATAAGQPPYCSADGEWNSVVLQIFPPDLIAGLSIRAIRMPDEDIRAGAPALSHEERVRNIAAQLDKAAPPFRIQARDTVALTFVDGMSNCENSFMEAVYRTGKYPCLFVGGSTGGKSRAEHSYIFDSHKVVEHHAVIVLIKLARGRGFGVLKSQNFQKTDQSLVVIEADADRRMVYSVIDPKSGTVQPIVSVLSRLLDVPPAGIMDRLEKISFGLELKNELFVRSVRKIDYEKGALGFYCDVNPGDTLHILQTTDFAAQTRGDITTYLDRNPPPLGVVLNDCVLRRQHNPAALASLEDLWPVPVAGFSTFGELFGIAINESLSALVFFDTSDADVRDSYIEHFPVYYARFVNHFTLTEVSRLQVMGEIRQNIISELQKYVGAGSLWGRKIQTVLEQTAQVRDEIKSVRTLLTDSIQRVTAAADATTIAFEFSDLSSTLTNLHEVLNGIDMIAARTGVMLRTDDDTPPDTQKLIEELHALIQTADARAGTARTALSAVEGAASILGKCITASRNNFEAAQSTFGEISSQIGAMVESSQMIEQGLYSLGLIVDEQRQTLTSVANDIAILEKLS